MNNGNFNNSSSTGDVTSWVAVIICLVVFWPVGLFLLLKKISFSAKKGSSFYSNYRPGQAPQQQNTSQSQQSYRPPHYNQQQKTYSQPQKPYTPQQSASASQQASRTAAPGAQPQQTNTPYRAQQSPHTQQGNSYAYAYQTPQKKATDNKSKKGKERKQSGKGLAAFLAFLGIIFSVVGVSFVSSAIGNSVTAGMDSSVLGTLLIGVFFCLGGIISFLSRIGIMGRVRLCNKYSAILGDRDVMSVTDMAKSAGVSPKKLRKDLTEMADNGYFGESAYFDTGLDSICMSSGAAEQAQSDASRAAEAASEKSVGSDNQYVAIINELHMLYGRTTDPSICANIRRIQELTAKIFKIVEDKPEKAPQIRRFMNYYLPTTLKLLHSYETLEKQGVNGDNIMSAKQDIERVLETLAAGFEQQLDNLFKSDKIDISADINVLENLMEQDGLTNEGNILKTAGGN